MVPTAADFDFDYTSVRANSIRPGWYVARSKRDEFHRVTHVTSRPWGTTLNYATKGTDRPPSDDRWWRLTPHPEEVRPA